MSRTIFRPVVSATLALATVAQIALAPLAQAASSCTREADKTAFEISELKSELMVIALSCDARDKYNAFVTRYQPDLQAGEKLLMSYFRRAFGKAAQKEHDDYITLLANAQSEDGIKEGTGFCRAHAGLFTDVMTVPTGGGAIADFAAGKNLVQPLTLVACATGSPAPITRTASVTVARKHN